LFGGGVLRVDGEVGGGEVGLEGVDDFGGAAYGVLVEIEAEFVGAAAGGRGVGRHVEDGGAGFDGSFGQLHWGHGPPGKRAFNAEAQRTRDKRREDKS
jgi:hypothetical protein